MNNTTRTSASSLKGWTKVEARAWMQAHQSQLPHLNDDFTKELGKVELAGKGAGQHDPHFLPKRTDIKSKAYFKAELETHRNYLPELKTEQKALRKAWEANHLQATIEAVRSYKDITKVAAEEAHDWQAKGRATQEVKRQGHLNITTIVLGEALPKHMAFDRHRGISGTSDQGINKTVLVPLTGDTDKPVSDPEVSLILDWAKSHITAGQFKAVFAWLTGEQYTSAQKAKGLNALKAQSAEWDQVRQSITGKHYCWNTVDAQFTVLGDKVEVALAKATPTYRAEEKAAMGI